MNGKRVLPVFIFLVVAFFLERTNGVAVMSVDIGSEWLKVAIVSPGVPMEIALNKESKRKTPMTISFRGKERTFGEDAQIVGLRFPKNSFSYFIDLLGKSIDNPIVKLYKERFPHYDLISNEERGTVAFKVDANTTYTPEELLAQILHKSREFAETSAGQKINEAVITVPTFFNQIERRSVMKAAELVDLKVLQLFNDNTAIALNYGIFRRKEINDTIQYTMFYDMGASSTTATIVAYQNIKIKDKGYVETTPQVSVIGIGYDRTLGGLEIQKRLQNYLADEFNRMGKTKNSVFQNFRAMAKLFKEAGRVKNILSANTDHYAQIEGLVDDHDFRLHVTREKLEELSSDVFERIGGPIDMALRTSGLTMSEISQVVLVGAGTRMPKVQDKLIEIVQTELAKNINTDEAAVLGAVYKAADLSQGFKVKKFITKDAVIFPIQVVFDRAFDGKTKQIRKTLFGKMNAYPQKKIITFNKHKNDFEFHMQYSELDHLPKHEQTILDNLSLSHVTLEGVAEAYEKHAQQKAESKGIRAHFAMDDSGILNLQNVELTSEKLTQPGHDEEEGTFSKLGSTISKLFSGSDDNEGSEKVEVNPKEDLKPVHEEAPEYPNANANQAEKSNVQNQTKAGDDKSANQTEKIEKKPTVTVIKDKINAIEIKHGPQVLDGDQFHQIREKINALNEYDARKARRETALNSLEAFVIDAKQKITSPEYETMTTSEEVENILKECDKIQEWLYEDGSDAEAEIYEQELSSMQKLTRDVYERAKEHRDRPDALKAMWSVINGSTTFLTGMRNLTEAEEIFTVVEMETLERIINETRNYYNEIVTSIKITPLNEPVKYKVVDIANKMHILDREVKYLVNKAKIWRLKSEKTLLNESLKNPPDDLPEIDPNSTSQSNLDNMEIPIETEESRINNEELEIEKKNDSRTDESTTSTDESSESTSEKSTNNEKEDGDESSHVEL